MPFEDEENVQGFVNITFFRSCGNILMAILSKDFAEFYANLIVGKRTLVLFCYTCIQEPHSKIKDFWYVSLMTRIQKIKRRFWLIYRVQSFKKPVIIIKVLFVERYPRCSYPVQSLAKEDGNDWYVDIYGDKIKIEVT